MYLVHALVTPEVGHGQDRDRDTPVDSASQIPGLFMGHDPTRGSSHEVFKMPRVGSGGVRNLAGRVGLAAGPTRPDPTR